MGLQFRFRITPEVFFLVVVILFIANVYQAWPRPATRAGSYVMDHAHLLSGKEQAELRSALLDYHIITDSQIIIITLPSLRGELISDVAMTLAKRWKPGEKGKNNGLVIVASKQEQQVRIEVGSGLASVFTDAVTARIIKEQIQPAFQQQHYYSGFTHAIQAIRHLTPSPSPSTQAHHGLSSGDFFILLIFLILAFQAKPNNSNSNNSHHHYPDRNLPPSSLDSDNYDDDFSGNGGDFNGDGSDKNW